MVPGKSRRLTTGIVDDQTFEAFYPNDPFCLRYRYLIEGDQLSITLIGHGCSTGDPPILNDRVAQTAILQNIPVHAAALIRPPVVASDPPRGFSRAWP